MLPVKKNTLVGERISCPIDDVGNKFWGTRTGELRMPWMRPQVFMTGGEGFAPYDLQEISPKNPLFIIRKWRKLQSPKRIQNVISRVNQVRDIFSLLPICYLTVATLPVFLWSCCFITKELAIKHALKGRESKKKQSIYEQRNQLGKLQI